MSSRKAIEFVYLDKRYKCTECDNVLQDPVQSFCGHRFCFSCWEALWKTAEQKCPDDGKVLQRHQVFRDKCAQKELLAVECFCCNKSRGCHWRGPLAKLYGHDAECPFSEEKCPYSHLGCNVVVVRRQLREHLEKECLVKVIDYPYCRVGSAGAKMPAHLKECGEFSVECPHGCDESEIPREKIPDHSKSCPKVNVQCGFSSVGCDFHGPVESLDERNRSHMSKHLTLSSNYIKEIVEQMKSLQVQLNESRVLNQIYETRLTLQGEALALNKQTLSMHQLKLARLEENLETQRKDIDELHSSIEAMIRSQGQARQSSERRLDYQEERLPILADEIMPSSEGPPPLSLEGVSFPSVRDTNNHEFPEPVEHALTLQEMQLADQHLSLQNREIISHYGFFLQPYALP